MRLSSKLKALLGITLIVLTMGCAAATPPKELLQRNDHVGLAAWYQEEARALRMRAEEMRQMAQYYEEYTPKQGQQSILVQHCKNLEDKYTKASEEAETLAKFHAEQVKNP